MEKKDIEALAELARINITEEEKESFAKDIGSILAYIDKIREVATVDKLAEVGLVYNAFREDEVLPKGENTAEEIRKQFPDRDGDFLKVKKIL